MPYVSDTHSLIWYMTNDPKLSYKAKEIFRRADDGEEIIFIPCIIFFELFYLTEKRKIPIDFDEFLAMIPQSENYKVEPLCLSIIQKSREIPRKKIPDPWDRLIAATSMHLRFPLITHDESLRRLRSIRAIW